MTGKAKFFNGTTPPAPNAGYTTLYVDSSDKHTKQIDDEGTVTDLLVGANNLQNYSVKDNTGAISQVIAAGGTYNVLTEMLEINESTNGVKPNYFDKNNVIQSTYLVESDNKFLFPSNLYTYNNDYVMFTFRVISTIDHGSVGANQTTSLLVRLKRFVDDSIVSTKEFSFSNKSARVDFKFSVEFITFVGDETDPYVVDGMYVEMENIVNSATSITLKECDVRLFRY